MQGRLLLAAFVSLALAGAPLAATAGAACAPSDFDRAVDRAGATLRAFNLENAARLQEKLALLAKKKNWTAEAREEKTREFLRDDRIAALDVAAAELLAKIDALGRPADAATLDCARLGDLEAAGVELLAVMKTKSSYAMAKIDGALGDGGKPPAPAVGAAGPSNGKPKEAAAAGKTGRDVPAPAPARPPAGAAAGKSDGAPPNMSSWTTTSELDPSAGRDPRQPPAALDGPPPGIPYERSDEGYTIEEIREASRGFFGTISSSLASVIEYAFSTSGRPSGYVLGAESGGAFLAGVRYGSGDLYLHRGETSKVYWSGPSLGYDFGAEGSRTMVLIYNLHEREGLFRRFTGVDGSAYLVGGVGITFLKGGDVLMAPIRSGLGLRIGANIGYIGFTPEPSWNPF